MKKYFVLLFSIAVLYSCSKYANDEDNRSALVLNEDIDEASHLKRLNETHDVKTFLSSSKKKNDYFGFTTEEMELIGTMHNTLAIAINNTMDLTCTDCLPQFNTVLKDLYSDELIAIGEDDLSGVDELVEVASTVAIELKALDNDLYEWNPNALSTAGFAAYDQIIDVVNTATSVNKAKNELNSLIADFSNSNFSTYELELLISASEVAKNSFELWAPTSFGGIGLFGLLNGGDSAYDSRWCWRCAALGDVAGLASYFTGLSVAGLVSAALIPGANAAIAIGAGAAAVGGSVVAGTGITDQN